VVEPALVAELEGDATLRRPRRQQGAEPVGCLLEVRGELEEDRPELVAERGCGVGEVAERLGDIAKPGEVRDLLWGLQDVGEAGGSGRGPGRGRLPVRRPIESCVGLDPWEGPA